MAKSRKSRPRSRAARGRPRPSTEPYRSITSQMTPAYDQAVKDGADAELRGDAATALRLHRSVPMFRRSTHGDRLQVLADLGDDAPGWLVSRWITVQARRRIWTGGEEAATRRGLRFVLPLLYPDGIPFDVIGCEWVEQVMPFVFERDWVVQQVDLYELGALRRTVDGHASSELLARADQVREWCSAPMKALRFEGRGGSRDAVELADLTSGATLEVLDLGLGEELVEGQHLLGRLVPTVAGTGLMFDLRPLPVAERAAKAVARDPQRWLATLHRLRLAGWLEEGFSHQPETSLSADLPRHAWMSLLGVPLHEAPDRDPDELVAAATSEALSIATQGAAMVERRRHVIGELMLDVSLTNHVKARFVRPPLLDRWQALAEVLPEPAGSRCRELAMWCGAIASPDLIA
jgi:hypothetical protein